MGRRWAILTLALLLALPGAKATETPIRFGLAAAVLREHLDLYECWAGYLCRKVGRPVQFLQRRTYREAMELLEIGENDFSWICTFPYAEYRDSNVVGLMAVPVFEGEPLYRSYIIVHKHSSFRTIADLERKVFAYSDPDSNSGDVVPRGILKNLGHNPDGVFRHTFFTYSHTETIEAVAERVADWAAVNSYVWEHLPISARPRRQDQNYPAPGALRIPAPVYRIGVDPDVRARMTDALLTTDKDPEGSALLVELMLDRFISAPPNLYDTARLNMDCR